jgi:uncharacterized protein YodC (DUF2158 family)
MPRSFQPGVAVREKGGDNSEMVVEGYDADGRVLCSLWAGIHRETRPFAEEALEVIPPTSLSAIARKLQQGTGSGGGEEEPPARP